MCKDHCEGCGSSGVHQESPVDYRGSALSPGSLEELVNAAIIFLLHHDPGRRL